MPLQELLSPRECPFCSPATHARMVAGEGSVFALRDLFPVTDGHLLIIPLRHTPDWFTLTAAERRDAETLLLRLRAQLVAADPTIAGFNIGVNCGPAAGQTVPHAHIHLIPRRLGDIADPRGGVRGVIPAKRLYSRED